MRNKKRIVITGLGVVSCFGNDVNAFYQKLLNGESGISPITQFPCEDYPTRFAANIKEFDPGTYVDKKLARRADPYINYTIVAGKKALEQSGINQDNLDTLNRNRCGILIGSGMGGMNVYADGVQTLLEKGHKRLTPFFVPYIITNMGGAILAIELGFMGPNYSISTACATSNNSIVAAANHIQKGDADLMICGGVEAPVLPIGLAGFCSCKALSQRNEDPTKASRPWDTTRDGFVLGEGAGVIVLETLEHAQARGATILAEYYGGGVSCDAHHLTEPRPDAMGVTNCIQNALQDADLTADQIDYINCHATSTPAGDMVEIRALKQTFKNPRNVIINATKSMIGHSLGAAGGMEAVAVVKAITDGVIHPTINLENPEPNLEFQIPTQAMKHDTKIALSNSFGFGGHNASIIIGKLR